MKSLGELPSEGTCLPGQVSVVQSCSAHRPSNGVLGTPATGEGDTTGERE